MYFFKRLWMPLIGLAMGMSVAAQASTPALLSAYFGLDNALPRNAIGLCRQAPNQDGMPVIFSSVIDPDSLDAADFAVITESGAVMTPLCATLSPAIDEGELRTVLLIGEFGDDGEDAPVRVEIVGDVLGSADGANFLGASVDVTPLSAGPSLILAELVPSIQMALGRESGRQQGDGCPYENTVRAVRVTWAGGVSNAAGDEAGEVERALYHVTVTADDGSQAEIVPFALADLGDGDNNHLLCLDTPDLPVSVFFPAGYLLDPNRDTLNPEAMATVDIPANATPRDLRDVRYCEIIPTYRRGINLRTEVYNTLGLNDCPAEAWAALDAESLKAELGAVNVSLNGPRYWVLNELHAVGGVTVSGGNMTFGEVEMTLRAVIDTRIGGNLVGSTFYTPNTVNRDTRYIYKAGARVYELVDSNGAVYIMQSYAQIADPELTIDGLTDLGARLTLPDGWEYRSRVLEETLIVASGGQATVINDDFYNSYQMIR